MCKSSSPLTVTPQSGFTMLELLLVVSISALLLLGVSQITQNWVNSETEASAGQHLQRVSNVVQKYVEANWASLPDTADALTDAAWNPILVPAPGISPPNLIDNLNQEGLLTAGALRSPLGTNLRIAFIRDTTVTPNIFRATIYAATALPVQRVLDSARQAGTTGGTISSFPNGAVAQGAFGQWQLPKNRILPGGVDPCPTSNTAGAPDGCLVALISYNSTTLEGPYLYRDLITGRTDLNTMNTTLYMNNNDILGGGSIQTNNLDVLDTASLGTTTVNGPATFNSDTTVTNGAIVNGNMNVTGDANFANNVNINAGNLNTKDLHADLVQAPIVRTNNLDSANMTVSGGNLTVDDNVNVNGNVNMAGAGSQVLATTINAGTINANSGTVTTGTMTIRNNMNVTGTVNVQGDSIIVKRLVSDQCVRIYNSGTSTYDDYGVCP